MGAILALGYEIRIPYRSFMSCAFAFHGADAFARAMSDDFGRWRQRRLMRNALLCASFGTRSAMPHAQDNISAAGGHDPP